MNSHRYRLISIYIRAEIISFLWFNNALGSRSKCLPTCQLVSTWNFHYYIHTLPIDLCSGIKQWICFNLVYARAREVLVLESEIQTLHGDRQRLGMLVKGLYIIASGGPHGQRGAHHWYSRAYIRFQLVNLRSRLSNIQPKKKDGSSMNATGKCAGWCVFTSAR